jgi:hypothetical protein
MNVVDRVLAAGADFVPLDLVRRTLLPPVQLSRGAAVVAARTLRHWELVLAPDPDHVAARSRWISADDETDAGQDPPVDDWAELSLSDAQARLSSCDAIDLQALLDYERSHGHRPRYQLLLEQRLATIA